MRRKPAVDVSQKNCDAHTHDQAADDIHLPDAPHFGTKLNQLAENILDELLKAGNKVSLDQRIDALKAVGTLHLGLAKLAGKMPKGDDDLPTDFSEIRKRVHAANGG